MNKLILTADDVCISNLKFWEYYLEIKERYSDIQIIAFVIANYRYQEDVSKSQEFKDWFEANKEIMEVHCHGYDHTMPQEGFRDDQEVYIKKALNILRSYMPKRFLYRPPGFRTLPKTERILKRLGFTGIAHQSRIKYFDNGIIEGIINSHCSDRHFNPIIHWKRWWPDVKQHI